VKLQCNNLKPREQPFSTKNLLFNLKLKLLGKAKTLQIVFSFSKAGLEFLDRIACQIVAGNYKMKRVP